MHIHILGICGTFMGGAAVLARQLGHKVTGSDANVYPPMSTLLESQGIEIIEGFDPSQLEPRPDLVVIGNAMSRGNPCVEYVLDNNLRYTSGPQWLQEFLLHDRWVLAVSGTHGKTTTSSMLAWILEDCGYAPGFLVGGVLGNFGISARLGESMFFVVEADEYDSAFFDKRSKFVHYHPRTLVVNNLEFDHADIFDDLEAIKRQFHHLVRTVPSNGRIFSPKQDTAIQDVLARGCWSERESSGEQGDWDAKKLVKDGSQFEVYLQNECVGTVNWDLVGDHNVNNALMAIAAARHVGVTPDLACESLATFINTKRRLEFKGEVAGVSVYDDFAHHPTAIELTLGGLRNKVDTKKIIAVLEPRSATMKRGVHKETLADSLKQADSTYLFQPDNIDWSVQDVADACHQPAYVSDDMDAFVAKIVSEAQAGDQILVMSNGGFGGIHQKLLDGLALKG
ncbi:MULTISPECIES: UDP-N-acetylmuramate:L-alanyl-gamma-D-glutamyl-meso-diaminopimelate ligase [Vibrio]|uniref:UDP-N-acetylmuramate--L-alanyl-gamma-D-glutamyl-meso-2,6-diaminoheptandioate ligase n=3 Tax=Vibrio cyclitrophicus TaxID=47951 RepID=A0A7Z1S1D4_9VIBR|nr:MULTISPECIES: UDP-N-acetylmuramate:L-alanyl-gamma-D-glutamyl-meso-diaminopimelate ligase [Vibrio]KNH10806.1 UDP-N-acetylmuramate:L-alanyl-gamma-D-glutamyl-meso-diaminopimelate ligase [Vibrio lentus]MBY7661784.1 UDP-N-acetylmuramate:L-alanyl-gamma-D-glutamyl-meso-diaminopimelate ligase [Vibrio atlanticus]ERM58750.1 UDP-N-acetylmuramate:L-alanyl-gamma-D-glutamyl-meso-diaminopimelate ligase [Vibrio cyclitrophicus FF75]KAA8596348.1 UDP-N-acetylmuramate:L-alanyl-gamma-D-glutamyl- meso-diaminopime|tara:strand:- start:578 stop:1936 length:1359 start_codon:yes stop_codon:yes gene_type:complete